MAAELASLQAELDHLRQSSSLQAVHHEQALHDLTNQLEQAQQAASQAAEALAAARAREAGVSGEKDELARQLEGERAAREAEGRVRAEKGRSEEDGERARRELVEGLERSEREKEQLKGQSTRLSWDSTRR